METELKPMDPSFEIISQFQWASLFILTTDHWNLAKPFFFTLVDIYKKAARMGWSEAPFNLHQIVNWQQAQKTVSWSCDFSQGLGLVSHDACYKSGDKMVRAMDSLL